jgi:hypothetical protein
MWAVVQQQSCKVHWTVKEKRDINYFSTGHFHRLNWKIVAQKQSMIDSQTFSE